MVKARAERIEDALRGAGVDSLRASRVATSVAANSRSPVLLTPEQRMIMKKSLAGDFASPVRFYTPAERAGNAGDLKAAAYAHGSSFRFAPGGYKFGAGDQLVARELEAEVANGHANGHTNGHTNGVKA